MTLWNHIRKAILKYPNKTLIEGTRSITYKELLLSAEEMSTSITHEKICAIYCKSEINCTISILACLSAEVTCVPLSPRYGDVYSKKILEKCDPTCVIVDNNSEIGVCRIIDTHPDLPDKKPAFIMWTSGTTGSPKGAMLSPGGILNNLCDIESYMSVDHRDSVLICRPLFHISVLTGELLLALSKGLTIVFNSFELSPTRIQDLISTYQITTIGGTPTFFSLIDRFYEAEQVSSVHTLIVSGECLDEYTGRAIRRCFPKALIYHAYGLTEASPRISYLPPCFFDMAPDFAGFPIDSVSIEIRDNKDACLGRNVSGLIWVKGKNVMIGYYKDDEMTRKALKSGWLCTGDVGFIDCRGLLKVLGRDDDLIIRCGMNIYPQEIESAIKKDDRVDEVMVFGEKDDDMGTRIHMIISGAFKSVKEVKRLCIQTLPSFQIPSTINLVDCIPKTISGKKERKNHG